MKVTANLFINKDGNIRVTKRDVSAYPTELAVQLIIDVPDIFFKRPMPRVELDVPESYLINPKADVVARWVAPDIAEALGIDIKTVEDGMLTMLKNKLPDEPKQEEGKK